MTEYILRRLLALIPVLLGASMVIFFTLRLFAPFDYLQEIMEEAPGASDPVVQQKLREEFGLDKPILLQYGIWMWGAIRGDMGTAWSSGQPVSDHIKEAMPVTLEIALLSTVLATILAIPLGVISAVRQNTGFDYVSRFISVIGLSIPNFVVATVLLLGPVMLFSWAPPISYSAPWENLGNHVQQMFLPIVSLGTALTAINVRMLRSTMLEVLRNDYVRTARAKGLRERSVIYRHALKNALIPVVTIIGTQVSFTLGGTVIIEQVFGLPGLGRLTLNSIFIGDFPQLQANVLYLVMIFLLVNLAVDISYAWLNPRIRYSSS